MTLPVARPMLTLTLLCGSVLALACPAQQPDPCGGKADMAAMRSCENQRYLHARTELNVTLHQLLQQSPPAARQRLLQAQAAWLRFQSADALYEASTAGEGTLASLLNVTTLAQRSEARNLELKKHLR